ncbi:unnamed protein product [Gadus morhua 'NCC']
MWRAELRVRYKPGLAAGRVLGVMVVVLRLLLVVVGGDVGARSATCVLREPREVLSACWAHCSDRAMMETVKENQAADRWCTFITRTSRHPSSAVCRAAVRMEE